MHQFGGFRFENASAAELTVLQVSNHEVADVRSAGSDAAGRVGLNEFVGFCGLRSAYITVGHERLQVSGKRLNKSGVRHLKRGVNVFRDVLFERLAGNALDNVTGQGSSIVGIGRSRAGRKNASREMVAKIFAERANVRGIGNE